MWIKTFFANTLGRAIPDEPYLKWQYRRKTGKKLHLDPPVTFNEKLQWLKIHDHNPLYTTLVDKIAVKEYVREKLGDEYIIPTLGVWDTIDDVDFDALPEQFVLKANHDSGSVAICRDRNAFDIEKVKQKFHKRMNSNHYWWGREWPYKNVKPRIFA